MVGKVGEAKRLLEETKEKETGKQEVKMRKVSSAKRIWGLLPLGLYGWIIGKRTNNLKSVNQKNSHAEGRTNTFKILSLDGWVETKINK